MKTSEELLEYILKLNENYEVKLWKHDGKKLFSEEWYQLFFREELLQIRHRLFMKKMWNGEREEECQKFFENNWQDLYLEYNRVHRCDFLKNFDIFS